MHIFGCKFSIKTETGDTVPDRKNFDSLLWAIVTVFQVTASFSKAPLNLPSRSANPDHLRLDHVNLLRS